MSQASGRLKKMFRLIVEKDRKTKCRRKKHNNNKKDE